MWKNRLLCLYCFLPHDICSRQWLSGTDVWCRLLYPHPCSCNIRILLPPEVSNSCTNQAWHCLPCEIWQDHRQNLVWLQAPPWENCNAGTATGWLRTNKMWQTSEVFCGGPGRCGKLSFGKAHTCFFLAGPAQIVAWCLMWRQAIISI